MESGVNSEVMSESLNGLRKLLIVLIAVMIIGIGGLGWSTYTTLRILESQQARWAAYETVIDKKASLISALRGALGYGGFIHHFKNFILRQELHRVPAIEASLEAAEDAIAAYHALNPPAMEAQALAEITTTIDLYYKRYFETRKLIEGGELDPPSSTPPLPSATCAPLGPLNSWKLPGAMNPSTREPRCWRP